MDAVLYYIAYPFLYVISKLPFSVFYALSDVVAWLLYNVIGYRKAVVRKNLTLVFPEKSAAERNAIEREFYTHLSDLFLEMIKSLSLSKEEMQKRFKVNNIAVLTQFEDKQKSCFIMCGHYASWEWMMSLGYHIQHIGYGIYTPLSNVYFDRLMQRIRKKHKAYLISRYAIRETLQKHQAEKHLGIYGFASDQSPRPTEKTYWRSFLGIEVPVFTGAERLGREHNIPLVFGAVKKVKRGYYELELTLLSEQPKEEPLYQITDKFTALLEDQIRAYPAYYFWTHNRFKFASNT